MPFELISTFWICVVDARMYCVVLASFHINRLFINVFRRFLGIHTLIFGQVWSLNMRRHLI